MRQKILFILFVLMNACSDSEKFEECIIKEAIVSYQTPGSSGPAETTQKFIYFHDGLNYTEIHAYLYVDSDGAFPAEPHEILNLSYEDDRITEVIITNTNVPDTYIRHTYSYHDDKLTKQIFNVQQGNLHSVETLTRYFIVSPKDSVYLLENEVGDDIIIEYKNGNPVRIGFPSATGDYEGYGSTWHFHIYYTFDQLPNVTKDYAVRYPHYTYGDHPVMEISANNMVSEELVYEDAPSFLFRVSLELIQGRWLKTYNIHRSGRTISYEYDCK